MFSALVVVIPVGQLLFEHSLQKILQLTKYENSFHNFKKQEHAADNERTVQQTVDVTKTSSPEHLDESEIPDKNPASEYSAKHIENGYALIPLHSELQSQNPEIQNSLAVITTSPAENNSNNLDEYVPVREKQVLPLRNEQAHELNSHDTRSINTNVPENSSEIITQFPKQEHNKSTEFSRAGFEIAATPLVQIKQALNKPVNVSVDFDYKQFDFDIRDDDAKRKYDFYIGLDKYKNEPAWSPDGKWIAFTDNSRIWIVSPDGGDPILVYESFHEGFSIGNIESLCFTPDSREITFKKDVYDESRGSVILLTGILETYTFPKFSNPIPSIESVDIHTGKNRVIIKEGYHCSWSRSGRYLCYLNWDSRSNSNEEDTNIHKKPAVYDIENDSTIILNVDPDKRYGKPTFNPDESHIVIPVRDGNGPIELFSIPLTGGEPEQLTFYDEQDGHGKYRNFPEYSPDGRWILCTDFTWNGQSPDMRLFVYSTVSREIFEIFENPEFRNSFGKWSSDGKQICYLVSKDDENFIYICDFFPPFVMKPADVENSEMIPFGIAGNSPNPFNMSTTIEFSLPEAGKVNLVIYNIAGQKIRELVAEQMPPGVHTVIWDGRDKNGLRVSSAMYIARLSSGMQSKTHKMILVK